MTIEDPAFKGAGTSSGLAIWRIEDFEVKQVPENEYGNFYNGDSYIVLNTKESKSGRRDWDIHFWLGEETSQDEAGVAAIKSVELDDLLGGRPVQHREVQNYESALFLSYFKKGIRYLKGGVKSGFNHVVDSNVKRLLRVKGRRNVRLHEMPLDVTSMNNGDCFILESGNSVFIYTGSQSGRMERIKAIQAANAIRDDVHCGRSQVKIIDANSSNSEVQEYFDELGGGSPDAVADGSDEVDDAAFEANFESKVALYKVSEDDSGELQVELVSEKPLKQECLESDVNGKDCFLLDGGINGLFVWIGKGSSTNERIGAMNLAVKYIEKKGYPKWLNVKRIVEGAEPPIFKSYFAIWAEPVHLPTHEQEQTQVDAPRPIYRANAPSFMPDDGSGDVEIWRVNNFDLVPIEEAQKGIFFGGDSYIIKYSYNQEGDRAVLYFWQGLLSSLDEKAASAMLTVKMDNEMGGKAIQVRVVHGQEPEHFLRIFQGKLVILMGGHASGFKNIHDYDDFDTDGTRLFQVRGTNDYNTRAEQLSETSSSLNSNDVFILETPSVTYLWIGQDSNLTEQGLGRNLTAVVSPGCEVLEIKEGEEPEEFWSALGGKEDYPRTRQLPLRPTLVPRLFKISDQSGRVVMDEICNFVQEDLSEDDVMILDSGEVIYIWIGQGATQEEKDASLKMTEDYLNSEPSDRTTANTTVITVKQGAESNDFRLFFGHWNDQLWEDLSKLVN